MEAESETKPPDIEERLSRLEERIDALAQFVTSQHPRKIGRHPEQSKATWKRAAKLQPRLLDLLKEAGDVQDDPSRRSFCANAIWYGNSRDSGMKDNFVQLVGWHACFALSSGATEADEKFIKSREAYAAAYRVIYEALPPCRDCICA